MSLQDQQLKHIKSWQSSGLTQTAYCQKQGLSIKTFSRWVKKHRTIIQLSEPVLIPVEIKPATPVKIPEPLRLKLTNGPSLELPTTISPSWLAELLQCLN